MFFLHLFDPVLQLLLWSMVPATPCYTGTQCLVECDSVYYDASPEPDCEETCTRKYRSCLKGCQFIPREKRGVCYLNCMYDWSECTKACKAETAVALWTASVTGADEDLTHLR